MVRQASKITVFQKRLKYYWLFTFNVLSSGATVLAAGTSGTFVRSGQGCPMLDIPLALKNPSQRMSEPHSQGGGTLEKVYLGNHILKKF